MPMLLIAIKGLTTNVNCRRVISVAAAVWFALPARRGWRIQTATLLHGATSVEPASTQSKAALHAGIAGRACIVGHGVTICERV